MFCNDTNLERILSTKPTDCSENGPRLQWSRKRLEKIYQLAKKEATVGPFTTHLVRAYRHRLEVAQDPAYDITEIHHPWWLVEEAGEGVRRLETEKDRDMGNPLKLRGVMPFEYYQQQGFEYIVTHNKAYRRYFERDGQKNFPSINRFYQDLFQKGELIKEFNPDSWWRSGPIVRIYRVRNP